MNVKTLIAKLSKPHWMPTDPRLVVKNLTVEHIGQLNLMWAMLDRKPITQGFFDNHLEEWALAGRISVQVIDGAFVREYATLFSEAEFIAFVRAHPDVFTRYLPMKRWNQVFRVKTRS